MINWEGTEEGEEGRGGGSGNGVGCGERKSEKEELVRDPWDER